MTKLEIEKRLSDSVNGAMAMSAAEFGRFMGLCRSAAFYKLKAAEVDKCCGKYWIPDIAKKMWEGAI